ncbi:DoxX family protein [Chryseobacterium arthrosphaerae]|uniref:DoxX family protein n=1 Tax=Chryseobacterium arthrosphaerae TaxID=651561 RepID=UPI0023E16ED7|nr:DoxX family protein [Chryseobacterium arthrosphaerae]WES98733.1 DoxX family protein [Chryseobacterium arthrosphaerae]
MKNSTYKKIYLTGSILISIWFGLSGFFELTRNPTVWDVTRKLGYPEHFIYILGVFKILGVILLLIPNRFNRLKEWVFAGMLFDIVFAFFSKIAVLGLSSVTDTLIAFVILAVTYYSFNRIHHIIFTAKDLDR